MRQSLFSLSISLFILAVMPHVAYAQCSYNAANDYVCANGASPPITAAPPTGAATNPINNTPPAEPIGTPGEYVDYANTSASTQAHVQPNLTQESAPLAAGQCAERTLAPNSTTSMPFTYDGSASSMNVAYAPGSGTTRMFISSLPGFDPMNTISPGVQNDFLAPCHAQANLPEICGESSCVPDPNNENTINLRPATDVAANPAGNIGNCPLVAGETYYMNIQNEGGSPICTAVGNNTTCSTCGSSGSGSFGGP